MEAARRVFNLRTGSVGKVSLMLWLYYPRGRIVWYPLERRLDGPHLPLGRFENKENLLSLLIIKSLFFYFIPGL